MNDREVCVRVGVGVGVCVCVCDMNWKQCIQIWPNYATLAKFYVFGKFLRVYLVLGKMQSLLWQIFVVVNRQNRANNLSIWSHCPEDMFKREFVWEYEGE